MNVVDKSDFLIFLWTDCAPQRGGNKANARRRHVEEVGFKRGVRIWFLKDQRGTRYRTRPRAAAACPVYKNVKEMKTDRVRVAVANKLPPPRRTTRE